jgi:predicted dehydrogenase
MTVKEIGIILHGATGRIGATQHLANALALIRAEGGLPSGTGRIMPRLLLVERNATRLAEVAHRYDVTDWTQNLDEALAKPDFPVFFRRRGDRAARGNFVQGYCSRQAHLQ